MKNWLREVRVSIDILKNWLKKNWLKVGILVAVFIILILFFGDSSNNANQNPQSTVVGNVDTQGSSSATNPTNQEIKDLQNQINQLKIQQLKSSQSDTSGSNSISATDLQPYLPYVGQVTCFTPDGAAVTGSGFLVTYARQATQAITNYHVIADAYANRQSSGTSCVIGLGTTRAPNAKGFIMYG